MTIAPVEGQPGHCRVDLRGSQALTIKCGQGSSAQWVRDQIFEQYLAQH